MADPDAVSDALDGVNAVLHQGALPSVSKSVQLPLETNEANIVGTLTLLGVSSSWSREVVYAPRQRLWGPRCCHQGREP